MIVTRRVALGAALALIGVTAGAQQRTPEEYAKVLDRPERVARLQVPRVVADLGLKPGDRVADIGAGSGVFTRPMARAVGPGGVVYAVDVDEGLLAIVARRAKQDGLENIRTLAGGADDPGLPERVDLALVCDTLHHIENRTAYLTNLGRHLKPAGRVAIIDYAEGWPEGHESMRFTLEELRGWMRAAGYRETAQYDYLKNLFFVVWEYGPA